MTDMKPNVLVALGFLAMFSSMATAQDAEEILDASGVQGGLVVVLGCDSPALLAKLRAGDSYLIHALDSDPGKVAAARTYLAERGLYGSVTAARWDGKQLPYADSLVNLLVMTGSTRISAEELTRALSPTGVVADIRGSKIEVVPKDWPAELDEWTHYLYDASNNAVSNDTVVAPPQGLRWTVGPKYARSHEHFNGISAMVTAGGRVFYIIDEGPISSVFLPPQWKLVARDAFSGVLLWKRPIANWESHLRGFRSGPPEIARRIVATDDRVYVSIDYGQPVTVLDAPTGKQITTLADTGGARELLLTGGVLYALTDDMTTAQHEERKERINETSQALEYWYTFPRDPLPMYGAQRIAAIKIETGELLWDKEFEIPGEVMPATMAVDDGRLCIQTASRVACFDALVGKEQWSRPRPLATSRFSWSAPTLVIHDGVVLTVDRDPEANEGVPPTAEGSAWLIVSGGSEKRQAAEMAAFSLDDGKELWRAPSFENYNSPQDIFVIDGVVWVGELRRGDDAGFTKGRDLKTGKVIATLPPQKAGGHHRCYRNKATVRWMLLGRSGLNFLDPSNGDYQLNGWARGTCQYGIMPANGLVYVPQHSCGCSPEDLLTGFNALSSRSSAGKGTEPLEKGPAYNNIPNLNSNSSQTEWPTYRRDAQRSGYQDLGAPGKPGVAWTEKLSPPITAPVAADGIVVVAETDTHTVHALSALDGKQAWTFVADGRIDSPPTLFGGLCLFGTRNGFVYCLRASNGELVWRFRAATRDRRIFAYEQLESPWPVSGSVLVDDKLSGGVPTAYFAAGRSGNLDGGIHLYALEVKTGKLLHTTDVNMAAGANRDGLIRARVLPDILSAQKGAVWMRGLGVDKNLSPVQGKPHLYAPRGFLDDTWWHRTYWVYDKAVGGGYMNWAKTGTESPSGRLLVSDGGNLIYGYGRLGNRRSDINHPEAGHVLPDPTGRYMLFAEALEPKPTAARWPDTTRDVIWGARLPFVAKAIVLTRDSLLVAGGASLTESAESHSPGAFWVASREDGSKMAECTLPAPPVLDGMALTGAGVFVSAVDGTVACLQTNKG